MKSINLEGTKFLKSLWKNQEIVGRSAVEMSKSSGVVILMFSQLPSIRLIFLHSFQDSCIISKFGLYSCRYAFYKSGIKYLRCLYLLYMETVNKESFPPQILFSRFARRNSRYCIAKFFSGIEKHLF